MRHWRFPRQQLRLDYRELRDGFTVEEKSIRGSCHVAPEWAFCDAVLRELFANPRDPRTRQRMVIFYLYFRCGFTAERVALECGAERRCRQHPKAKYPCVLCEHNAETERERTGLTVDVEYVITNPKPHAVEQAVSALRTQAEKLYSLWNQSQAGIC